MAVRRERRAEVILRRVHRRSGVDRLAPRAIRRRAGGNPDVDPAQSALAVRGEEHRPPVGGDERAALQCGGVELLMSACGLLDGGRSDPRGERARERERSVVRVGPAGLVRRAGAQDEQEPWADAHPMRL